MCNINQLQRGCATCKCNRDTRSVWLTCYSSPDNEIQLCVCFSFSFFSLKKKKIRPTCTYFQPFPFINRFLAKGIKYLNFYKFNRCDKCCILSFFFFILRCTKFLLDENFIFFGICIIFNNCLRRLSVEIKIRELSSPTTFLHCAFIFNNRKIN